MHARNVVDATFMCPLLAIHTLNPFPPDLFLSKALPQTRQNVSPSWLVLVFSTGYSCSRSFCFSSENFCSKRSLLFRTIGVSTGLGVFVSPSPIISSPIILFIYLFDVQEIFSVCNIGETLSINMENNI